MEDKEKLEVFGDLYDIIDDEILGAQLGRSKSSPISEILDSYSVVKRTFEDINKESF